MMLFLLDEHSQSLREYILRTTFSEHLYDVFLYLMNVLKMLTENVHEKNIPSVTDICRILAFLE